jgi:hypothetical protein
MLSHRKLLCDIESSSDQVQELEARSNGALQCNLESVHPGPGSVSGNARALVDDLTLDQLDSLPKSLTSDFLTMNWHQG